MEGTYRIRSKMQPTKLMFIGTSHNIEASIQWHKAHLYHKMHPVPELQNHMIKFGIDDFEFIVEPIESKPVIEKAVMKVKKETRKVG